MRWRSLSKKLKYVPRVIWISCVAGIAVTLLQSATAQKEHQQLSEQKKSAEVQTEQIEVISIEQASAEPPESFAEIVEIPVETPSLPAILPIYEDLYDQNHHLAGWLTIEGTLIDYPVMQCDDNEYYLHHNFAKEESKYGELFVKAECSLDRAGTNTIIYGHHMRDGSMFGSLENYKDRAFYEEHPQIQFDTLYEQHTYEVIAAFRSQVYDETEDVFQYYQYYDELTEEEFVTFYENIKKMSCYDTGVDAAYGDTLLTLSTCAYHVKDGRFVVVAKRN